jgi:hypothetical protein
VIVSPAARGGTARADPEAGEPQRPPAEPVMNPGESTGQARYGTGAVANSRRRCRIETVAIHPGRRRHGAGT